MTLDRRIFIRMCSALAGFFAEQKASKVNAQERRRAATRNRKNFVAIQVKPYAWVDEGIDSLLDNIQHKGEVNTVWAYTYDYAEARMRPNGPIPLPDHGRAGDAHFTGGAFYDYDPKYFRNTSLKD